jgi:hypothetical protein
VYQDTGGLAAFNMLANFRRFQDAAPGSALRRRALTAQDLGRFEYDVAAKVAVRRCSLLPTARIPWLTCMCGGDAPPIVGGRS